jgi:hypothetical protein
VAFEARGVRIIAPLVLIDGISHQMVDGRASGSALSQTTSTPQQHILGFR